MSQNAYTEWYVTGLQAIKSADDQAEEAAQAATGDLSDTALIEIAEDGAQTAARHSDVVSRLLQAAGGKPGGIPNKIMEGIRVGTAEATDAARDPEVKDASGVAAAQISLPYDIAAYGTLASTAKHLGRDKDAGDLKGMTEELIAIDKRYSEAAEARTNQRAS